MQPILDLLDEFFRKEVPVEQEPTKKDEWCPRMSGTMVAYKPQWKDRGAFGESINKRFIGLQDGKEWRDVPFTIIRGGASVTLPDGREMPLGVPFPRHMPGIHETIYLCGHEQAMALAWGFAAHVAAAGGEIEVRAEAFSLEYEVKAKPYEGKGHDAAHDEGEGK